MKQKKPKMTTDGKSYPANLKNINSKINSVSKKPTIFQSRPKSNHKPAPKTLSKASESKDTTPTRMTSKDQLSLSEEIIDQWI